MEWLYHICLYINLFKGFCSGSDGKECACNAGNLDLTPGLRRFLGEGNSYPFQYSGLENSVDRGPWQAIVHGVTKSWIWLSDIHFTHLFKDFLVASNFGNYDYR